MECSEFCFHPHSRSAHMSDPIPKTAILDDCVNPRTTTTSCLRVCTWPTRTPTLRTDAPLGGVVAKRGGIITPFRNTHLRPAAVHLNVMQATGREREGPRTRDRSSRTAQAPSHGPQEKEGRSTHMTARALALPRTNHVEVPAPDAPKTHLRNRPSPHRSTSIWKSAATQSPPSSTPHSCPLFSCTVSVSAKALRVCR